MNWLFGMKWSGTSTKKHLEKFPIGRGGGRFICGLSRDCKGRMDSARALDGVARPCYRLHQGRHLLHFQKWI